MHRICALAEATSTLTLSEASMDLLIDPFPVTSFCLALLTGCQGLTIASAGLKGRSHRDCPITCQESSRWHDVSVCISVHPFPMQCNPCTLSISLTTPPPPGPLSPPSSPPSPFFPQNASVHRLFATMCIRFKWFWCGCRPRSSTLCHT